MNGGGGSVGTVGWVPLARILPALAWCRFSGQLEGPDDPRDVRFFIIRGLVPSCTAVSSGHGTAKKLFTVPSPSLLERGVLIGQAPLVPAFWRCGCVATVQRPRVWHHRSHGDDLVSAVRAFASRGVKGSSPQTRSGPSPGPRAAVSALTSSRMVVPDESVESGRGRQDCGRRDLTAAGRTAADQPGEGVRPRLARRVRGPRRHGHRRAHLPRQRTGAARGMSTAYVYELDGVYAAHLGEVGHRLDPDTIREIGHVDVLCLGHRAAVKRRCSGRDRHASSMPPWSCHCP